MEVKMDQTAVASIGGPKTEAATSFSRPALVKALPVLVSIDAGMWLVGVPPTLYYAFINNKLPMWNGIKLLGGPFERLGLDGLIVAGLMFVTVSAFKILAAYWLRQARKDGAVLALILLGLSAIFWYGFALPLGPVVGAAEIFVLARVWRMLR